jgi:[ribosomal protein S5]-alanine N-acetyltransferase
MTLLLGDRIRLRLLDDRGMREFFDWWNDPRFWGDYSGFALKTWQEFEEFVKGAPFFIIEKNSSENKGESSKKIGWISYFVSRTDYPYLYEIGYALDPGERGKGYTREAAKLIVDFLFTTKNIERIEAVTDVDNVASQRVLESVGFKREGTLRKRSFTKGEYRDEYIYSILSEEWHATS